MKNNKKIFSMNEDNTTLENEISLENLEEKNYSNNLSHQIDEVVQGLSGAKLAGQIYLVDLDKLEPYPNQPFKEYSPERLQELAEDIARVGILSPILTRKSKNKLQILAGHNRWAAAKIANLDKVPIIVLDLDDDQAILVLTSTNLRQRQILLPSEKAFAYKMQMDAIKRQGKRKEDSNKNSLASNLITEQTGDSRMQIHRFIRLTELDSGILELLDKNKISMTPAVTISYLHKESQQQVCSIIKEYNITLNIERANTLKNTAIKDKNNKLNLQEIQLIMLKTEIPYFSKTLKIKYNNISEYLPSDITIDNAEDFIINALKNYKCSE